MDAGFPGRLAAAASRSSRCLCNDMCTYALASMYQIEQYQSAALTSHARPNLDCSKHVTMHWLAGCYAGLTTALVASGRANMQLYVARHAVTLALAPHQRQAPEALPLHAPDYL
jgi:hypothetical protein